MFATLRPRPSVAPLVVASPKQVAKPGTGGLRPSCLDCDGQAPVCSLYRCLPSFFSGKCSLNDVLLWRILTGRAQVPAPAEFCALLEQLGQQQIRDRFPFLGVLAPAISHPVPEIRAAALKVLAGSDGLPGLRHIVEALNDESELVQRTAVDALTQSVSRDPERFAHAVFHPNSEVRSYALSQAPWKDVRWFALFHVQDGSSHDVAADGLKDAAVPVGFLPEVFELIAEGHLSQDLARLLIGRMGAGSILNACINDWKPARKPARAILRAAESNELPAIAAEMHPPSELLQKVVDLFWDYPEQPASGTDSDENEEPSSFLGELVKQVTGGDHGAKSDVIAAILLQAAACHGTWPAVASGVCALAYPRFLGFSWVPRDVRRSAVTALYEYAHGVKHGKKFVQQLVHLDICRRESGELDLWVLGGILHFIKRTPYKTLQEWIGADEIVSAALENLDDAVPFLSLEDKSKEGQSFLIERVAAAAGVDGPAIMAMLLCASATDRLEKLDFVCDLDSPIASSVANEVLRLTLKPGVRMSERKQTLLGQILGAKMGDPGLGIFLGNLLSLDLPHKNEFGMVVLETIVRQMNPDSLAQVVFALDTEPRRRLLVVIQHCDGFSYGKESMLAAVLIDHPDPQVREWAEARVPPTREEAPEEQASWTAAESQGSGVISLTPTQVKAIAGCSEKELPKAVAPCLLRPTRGLTKALAKRRDPIKPLKAVASALMVSSDPLDEVDRELTRFGSNGERFASEVDQFVLRRYERSPLPIQGNALIHRFEFHCFAFRDAVEAGETGLAGLLKASLNWRSGLLRGEIWSAAEHLMGIWRWREPRTFPARCSTELIDVLGQALFSRDGVRSGNILMKIHNAKAAPALMTELRDKILPRLLELDDATRKSITAWIDSTGLVTTRKPKPKVKSDKDIHPSEIAVLTDMKRLGEACRESDPEIAEAAALRLIELGAKGLTTLFGAVCADDVSPCISILCGTLPLWPESAALRRLRKRLFENSIPPEAQMFAAIGLLQRGEEEFRPVALAAPCREVKEFWFSQDHWQALLDAGVPEDEIAINLTISPQPQAYMPALEAIFTHPAPTAEMEPAVEAFLEMGTRRIRDLRLQAAHWLSERDNHIGLPLLIWDMALGRKLLREQKDVNSFLAGLPITEVDRAIDAYVTGGPAVAEERGLARAVLSAEFRSGHGGSEFDAVTRRLLNGAKLQRTRNAVVAALRRSSLRQGRFRQLAEAFAWGVVTGRDLSGQTFKVEMHGGEALGYTRLNEDKLFITPMPILRGDKYGREIVEGLIVHELGHHLYHKGDDAREVWTEAAKEGLSSLLNLVQDEHLERRLRSYDEAFGHRFKWLAAHAFQHSDKEWKVEWLLERLRLRALPVLTAASLRVAGEDGCVLVLGGQVLQELERLGSSFTRFFRALRMGLGDRHRDPKVAEALKLFGANFRNSTNQQLLAIARRLKKMFPSEAALLELMRQDGLTAANEGEVIILGEGISDGELQKEIDRILNPHDSETAGGGGGPGGIRVINVSPDESFDLIQTVVRLDCRPERHAAYARRLGRNAHRMREYFESLGLVYVPQRMRVSGRQLDRTRIPAVVLRGDPRMLIARQVEARTDLFLGLLVDCSGSMDAGNRIEQAKLFAVLLAEAAKGMRSIDVRVFGFTDSVIYDAGNARQCAAHALRSGGGNNDAAALWHAAMEARSSRRKAKLLIMISDGSPTECSTHALRALVTRLQSRMGIACAQVAVRHLDEICFPHYVEIESQDQAKAVAEFGKIIVKLVGKTIRGA